MKNSLSTPARFLKGIGPKRARSLAALGINCIEDFLYFFPRRYEDRTKFTPISALKENEIQTIKGEVLARGARQSFRRRRFSIVEIAVADASGRIPCVWFNQPYLNDYFKVATTLILYGKVQRYAGKLQMNNPEFELVDEEGEEALNVGRIVPVYRLPQGLTQRYFRRLVKEVLDGYLAQVNDSLPYDIRTRNSLLNLAKSFLNIHFPESADLQKEAFRRLSFEEFFLFQVPLALRKLKKKEKTGIAHKIDEGRLAEFIRSLPFKLTASQERVIAEIKNDLAWPQPMQRLLQGDVGSGKTVVATAAAVMVIQGGHQAALMAPTEILAKQHYEKIRLQTTDQRPKTRQLNIGLLTSSASKKTKEEIYREIKEGKIDLVIGTHALLEEGVEFKKLGLVIIDEQHKFGVGQRQLLPQKGLNPDCLIMTATPIPRTLAITIYGDLDLSVITEMPAGRLPVKTLHFSEGEKIRAYDIAKEQLRKGLQAYIIYPVIEESFALDIAGAKKVFEELKKKEFKDFRLGLVHGQLKEKEQDAVMAKFKNKELDVLIATTVLEVGIDIPNAACMIIEHAGRFGLGQLHQLRGRVGRGSEQSFCLLISDAVSAEAKARLAAMEKYHDGFRIAEEDLKIRGPGEFFGSRQHGLSELRIGNPLTQMQLLKRAREEALRLIALDPHLESRPNLALKERLLQRFPEYEKLMLVG